MSEGEFVSGVMGPIGGAMELAAQWAFTHCLACRSEAWLSPAGEVFCPTCEHREARLQAALASVARPPVFESLRSALLGSSTLSTPQVAAW